MTEQKVNIAQEIEKLIRLQEVDSIIYRLKNEKEQKPVKIQNLTQQIEQEEKDFQEKTTSLKSLQVKRKEKEVDLEAKENQIKKLNTQLYQLKTNKEYDAMKSEIGGLKADCSVLEEEILKIMDDVEKEQQRLAGQKAQMEQRQQKISAEIKNIEEEMKSIENELSKEREKRKSLAADVDPKILRKYDRILEAKDGLAMVPIDNDACGGCFMQLPPQVINEIRLKNDIVYCQICSRILYSKD